MLLTPSKTEWKTKRNATHTHTLMYQYILWKETVQKNYKLTNEKDYIYIYIHTQDINILLK